MSFRISKFKKRGDISTVFVSMISILIISVSFVMYMDLNITTMKYQNMSQYARDSLLILETQGNIEKDYLLDIKQDLSSKLNMKTGETFNIFIQVGDGTRYNINSMPTELYSDFGDSIKIEFVYNYNKKIFGIKNESISPSLKFKKEDMIVNLSTISKNRRTSDG